MVSQIHDSALPIYLEERGVRLVADGAYESGGLHGIDPEDLEDILENNILLKKATLGTSLSSMDCPASLSLMTNWVT